MTTPYLGNPKYTIEVLQKYGFVFQKRFGQNFLIDTHVLDRRGEESGTSDQGRCQSAVLYYNTDYHGII